MQTNKILSALVRNIMRAAHQGKKTITDNHFHSAYVLNNKMKNKFLERQRKSTVGIKKYDSISQTCTFS